MDATRCPYCLAALVDPSASASDSDEVVMCLACGTAHHRACFEEHGACTIFGCQAGRFRVVVRGERPAPPRTRSVIGALHPFLPLGAAPLSRRPGFLSTPPPSVSRARHVLSSLELRLELPAVAVAGRPLEGRLIVDAPAAVQGLGLRLRVESLLHGPGGVAVVGAEEAAFVGGPARPWTERLLPWSRPRLVTLVRRGRASFPFSLDVERLRWRGVLPDGGFGPVQSLRLTAELDGDRAARSVAVTLPIVEARAPLSALPDAPAHDDAPAPALHDLGGAWSACPVRAGPAGWPTGVAGVRRDGLPSASRVDVIDLVLEPLEPGPPVLRGKVTLTLGRALDGEVVLGLVVERRPLRAQAWHVHAREELVLATGDGRGRSLAGTHVLSFEHGLGASFAPRGKDRRCVRLQAVLRGAGRALRSDEVEVQVAAPRRRRARRRLRP